MADSTSDADGLPGRDPVPVILIPGPVKLEPGEVPTPVFPVRDKDGSEGTLGSEDATCPGFDTLVVRERSLDFSLSPPETSLITLLTAAPCATFLAEDRKAKY